MLIDNDKLENIINIVYKAINYPIEFNEYQINTAVELISISPILSARTLNNKHGKFDKQQRMSLLCSIIKDSDALEYLSYSTYVNRCTDYELQYLINKIFENYELNYQFINVIALKIYERFDDLEKKFKRLKLSKNIEDKLISLITIQKLKK